MKNNTRKDHDQFLKFAKKWNREHPIKLDADMVSYRERCSRDMGIFIETSGDRTTKLHGEEYR